MGIASPGGAGGSPGEVSSSLSKICHLLVTLRETRVLYARLRYSAWACRVLGLDFCVAGAPG